MVRPIDRVDEEGRGQDSAGAAPAAVTAPEAKPRAGATSVNGRESSIQSRARGLVHARPLMSSAANAAMPVLMKFSDVVVQDSWSFERRAEAAFDERSDSGRGDDGDERRARHDPERHGDACERAGAD